MSLYVQCETLAFSGWSTITEAALLADIVTRIRAVLEPDRIVMFGSRARGTATDQSDVDILVIAPSNAPRCRYGACGSTRSTMSAAVSAVRRAQQDGHTRPLHEKATSRS